jgi:hypothetical protein
MLLQILVGTMTFEEMTRAAARAADGAVSRTMRKYALGAVTDEEAVTGVLVGQLDGALEGQIGGLIWNTTVVRHHRGRAAEENRIGADLIVHVSLQTATQSYSKGVLIQAKRVEPDEHITSNKRATLLRQCRRMLNITPADVYIRLRERTHACRLCNTNCRKCTPGFISSLRMDLLQILS